MLMGAGYASWTNTLTISNTVKTGNLDIKFDQGNFSGFMYPNAISSAPNYITASAIINTENAHSMEINLNGLYPGSWAAFRVKGVNVGTIPAKLDSIDIKFGGNTDLLQDLTYETNVAIDPDGKNNKVSSFNSSGYLKDLASNLNNSLKNNKNMQLEPNGCFYIGVPQNGLYSNLNSSNNIQDGYIVIKFNETNKNGSQNNPNQNELQNKTLTFTMTINFKQFNQ